MSADNLTADEAAKIGKAARDYDNLLIGSFAAELAGESYPFSAAMTATMLRDFNDEELGRRFAKWCDTRASPPLGAR